MGERSVDSSTGSPPFCGRREAADSGLLRSIRYECMMGLRSTSFRPSTWQFPHVLQTVKAIRSNAAACCAGSELPRWSFRSPRAQTPRHPDNTAGRGATLRERTTATAGS